MTQDRDLYSGLIRLHILYHAVREPIYGLGIMEELGRHGYKLSAGTLYPLLHGLEKKGYLHSGTNATGKARGAFTVRLKKASGRLPRRRKKLRNYSGNCLKTSS
jgi:DNA-binding PadR family transcriptional regulator